MQKVIKLYPEKKTVSVNMMTCLHIGQTIPIATEVDPIPQTEL